MLACLCGLCSTGAGLCRRRVCTWEQDSSLAFRLFVLIFSGHQGGYYAIFSRRHFRSLIQAYQDPQSATLRSYLYHSEVRTMLPWGANQATLRYEPGYPGVRTRLPWGTNQAPCRLQTILPCAAAPLPCKGGARGGVTNN